MAKGVLVFHNILWSKYKGGVFSALSSMAHSSHVSFSFCQIAETEGDRVGLSGVDLSYHRYPYKLLFEGSYDQISSWRLIASLVREVWSNNADLVILPGYHRLEFWAMLVTAKVQRKKCAVFCDSTIYDRPASKLKAFAKRVFFSLCDGYFGYGQRSKEYLLSLGAADANIFYRCQAAALPHDYSETSALVTRLKNVSQMPAARFLYAGRLSWEKDLRSLLSAFALVLKDLPEAKLVVVGNGTLRDELEEISVDLAVRNNVEFLGGMSIDALALEYAKATCFVLTSKSEPWGLVVNEALSYGCPVVVSNVCGCVPELVVAGVTGYSFQVGNVPELAQCMATVARTFVDHSAVAQRCIQHISAYSPERAAQQILDGSLVILERRGA